MRQQLWKVNSSLLFIFFISIIISLMFREKTPINKQLFIPSKIIEKQDISPKDFEYIYKNDLFSIYIETVKPYDPLTSIPEFKLPPRVSAPIIKEPDLLPPLNITLKGILYALDNQSIALIEDETKKEQSYTIGEKIKDAQIIKINKDRVVLLRDNGQQESLTLRLDDADFMKLPENEKLESIIKKINENTYLINPFRFSQEIKSLGQFIDTLSPSNAYKNNQIVGFKIGKLNNEICSSLGLLENDIIYSINNLPTKTAKNRYKIFEQIQNLKVNNEIYVNLERNNQKITLTYKLAILEKSHDKLLYEMEKNLKSGIGFKLNRDQKREQTQKVFESEHAANKDLMILNIRERLLKNMEQHEKTMRVR